MVFRLESSILILNVRQILQGFFSFSVQPIYLFIFLFFSFFIHSARLDILDIIRGKFSLRCFFGRLLVFYFIYIQHWH